MIEVNIEGIIYYVKLYNNAYGDYVLLYDNPNISNYVHIPPHYIGGMNINGGQNYFDRPIKDDKIKKIILDKVKKLGAFY